MHQIGFDILEGNYLEHVLHFEWSQNFDKIIFVKIETYILHVLSKNKHVKFLFKMEITLSISNLNYQQLRMCEKEFLRMCEKNVGKGFLI